MTLPQDAAPPDRGRPEEIRAVPVRHPGRWVAVVVIAVLAAMLGHLMVTSSVLHWDVVGQIFTYPTVLAGVGRTLELTALAMVIGIVGGVLLAVMRLSKNPVLSGASWIYIWVFRGTPVLVQLFFWNFLGALVPKVGIGIPFGPTFASWNYNDLVGLFTAATLALGLNEAAYFAEIVRAGILSVDEGQAEAASSLGLTHAQTLWRIVLPQAMRVIIPPAGNETISMLKTTSLVSAIALEELTRAGQDIASRTFYEIPALVAISFWYLLMTSILSIGQYYVERYYSRGTNRVLPDTPWQKVRKNLLSFQRHEGAVG
ncbi:amino acid ABC transporter permease [Streptacidiphilus jiangxiensis]|uniref:Polar amino acid transport system permease protein n=1 Tax=Streptacidiphilus jiangxiensis TaxID=235985 RepID=A0A1H7SM44_STRJI|nr:polar amino acid transport system permease protein [Streptacidiphilus jiangxiensis]